MDVKLTKTFKEQNKAGSTLIAINKKRGDTASPQPAHSRAGTTTRNTLQQLKGLWLLLYLLLQLLQVTRHKLLITFNKSYNLNSNIIY